MDKYYFSSEISKVINPPPISKYYVRQRKAIEDLYPSQKKAPLGCTPTHNIPHKNINLIFGIPTVKDISAQDLMYPSEKKVNQSVYSEVFSFKKSKDSSRPAGIKLDHCDNTGGQTKELLNIDRNKYSTIIVPSSYTKKHSTSCFKGKSFEENTSSDYCNEENRRESNLKNSLKARTDRNCVEVLWNLLKMKNHTNFLDLVSAFQAYKNGSDKITLSDLQFMCQKFGISVPLHVIEKLVEECDIIDKDGAINYEEFIHCLNWKDLIPENHNFKSSKYENCWREGLNNPSEDVLDFYRTTTSFIGDHKYAVPSRNAGLPSFNKEVDRSNLKGISQFNEYGDASSMIQPNSFSKYGVFEEDLKTLYSKDQIKLILADSGIKFSDEVFEVAWNEVNFEGKASIGKLWNVLKTACLKLHCWHF